MAKKTQKKPTKTAKTNVKNTKTEVVKREESGLRWYHLAATIVVLMLVVVAIIRIFSHFDISLFGSRYSVKYQSANLCTIAGPLDSDENSYRYAGIKDGDMIGTSGLTSDLGEAFIEIVSLDSSNFTYKTRNPSTNVWTEHTSSYGKEIHVSTNNTIADVCPTILFTINR